MKRNSLTALFIVMAFASCTIDNDEAGYAYDQEEATNFEDAISSVVGTLDLGATIPDLTFHEIRIINDAAGSYYDCYANSNPKDLANAIILSLITPVIQDSMAVTGPNTLADSIIYKQNYATAKVMPSSPINGVSYTFADSIGYYHNYIISEILKDDPYGNDLFTMSFEDIINTVDRKVVQLMGLSKDYFTESGYDETQLSMACDMSYVLHNYTGTASYVNLMKQKFPTVLSVMNSLYLVSQQDMTYSGMNQMMSALSPYQDTSSTNYKKALIVEFASERLWK